jgi:transcription elongation GreA/GreB family factor
VEKKKKAVAEGGDVRPFDRDLRYLEARVNTAIVVPPGSGDEIRFGAYVTIENTGGVKTKFQIVGEDEARTGSQFLAWSSPLVEELFGKKAGDAAKWVSETGAEPVKIVSVRYNL